MVRARDARSLSAWQLDRDRLDLGVGPQGLEALLAAVAGALVSAERQLDAAAGAVGVDVDLAGADLAGEPVRDPDVARPHGGDQSVIGGVRGADRLVGVAERRNGEDRAEHLLARDTRIRRYPVEQRGGEVIAALQTIVVRRIAPGHETSVGLPYVHIAAHALELLLADQRSEVGILRPRPDPHRREPFRDRVD